MPTFAPDGEQAINLFKHLERQQKRADQAVLDRWLTEHLAGGGTVTEHYAEGASCTFSTRGAVSVRPRIEPLYRSHDDYPRHQNPELLARFVLGRAGRFALSLSFGRAELNTQRVAV